MAARSIKSREATLFRADGVVAHKSHFKTHSEATVVSDHPVRSTKEASRHLLDVVATPPYEGNNILDASCTQIKGEILKSDKSCISNPKSEMSDWTGTSASLASYAVQSEFSDFGFEMQDSSNFEMSFLD